MLLERHNGPGQENSSRNSEVIHSGEWLYWYYLFIYNFL